MIDRFARLRSAPRQLTDSERLQLTVIGAAVIVALELWFGERLGFGLGLVAGWVLCVANRWLDRRGG